MPPPEDPSPSPRGAGPDALAGLAPGEARAVLADSWVTDGQRGYFIDTAACAAGQAFSLYETMWQLHLLERSGRGCAGVIPSRVLAWTGSALDGRLASSGLPAIGQLWYAVRILSILGCRPAVGQAAATLAALRSGGRYLAARASTRTGTRAGTRPDWGSTALAVAIQRELGLPVPGEVVATAMDAVLQFDRAAVPPSALTGVVSVLQVAAGAGGALTPSRLAPALAPALARMVSGAESALLRLPPDPVWLAQFSALRRAAALLGVPIGRGHQSTCARLLDSDGSVRLPGQPGPDAQATYYALDLDWPGARAPAPAPHSRAGWPTARAAAGGAAASVAALRSAAALGLDEPFRAPLARQLTEVWRPAQRSAGHPASRATEPDMQALAGLLGQG